MRSLKLKIFALAVLALAMLVPFAVSAGEGQAWGTCGPGSTCSVRKLTLTGATSTPVIVMTAGARLCTDANCTGYFTSGGGSALQWNYSVASPMTFNVGLYANFSDTTFVPVLAYGQMGGSTITDTSASPGNATINAGKGRAAIAAAATTVIITDNMVNTDSVVLIEWEGALATAATWGVTPLAGSFTVALSASQAAAKTFRFVVIK